MLFQNNFRYNQLIVPATKFLCRILFHLQRETHNPGPNSNDSCDESWSNVDQNKSALGVIFNDTFIKDIRVAFKQIGQIVDIVSGRRLQRRILHLRRQARLR